MVREWRSRFHLFTVNGLQVFRFQAVKWGPNGEIHELSPLKSKGDTVAFAWGINDRGQAVGTSGTCSTVGLPPASVNGQHAVMWERDGTPRYLGTLGDANNTMSNTANSINELGEIDGTSQVADGTVHAFLWTKQTGMQDIGTLPGAFATVAPCCNTINNRSEVVGFSIDGKGPAIRKLAIRKHTWSWPLVAIPRRHHLRHLPIVSDRERGDT